jgi:hypothetical protein
MTADGGPDRARIAMPEDRDSGIVERPPRRALDA